MNVDGRRFPADNRQLITDYCLSTAKDAKVRKGNAAADFADSRRFPADNRQLASNRQPRTLFSQINPCQGRICSDSLEKST